MAAIETDTIINNYIHKNNLNIVVIETYEGITQTKGCNSGKNNINPCYLVMDTETTEQFILMEIRENIYTKLSLESIDKIKETNSSWFLCKNGYIASNFNGLQIYLHQYLMNLYGQGKGSTSIDHINRDKLDNRLCNLRYANASLQNSNMSKKQRQKTAQGLPEGITQSMLPKYVYYCTETINKNSTNEYVREFFRIESHPNLQKKCVSSSKSTKVSIIDKLNEINTLLQQLDLKETLQPKKQLPQYISVHPSKRTKDKLVIEYDRRINGKRESMKKTIDNTDDPHDFLEEFCNKIFDKYHFNPLV